MMRFNFSIGGIFFILIAILIGLAPFWQLEWSIADQIFKAIIHFLGISYFGFPLLALYIGVFILKGKDFYYFINQSLKIGSFLAVLFLTNLCMLNVPSFFSGDWSGLLPMIAHVLLINLLEETQKNFSWQTLTIEFLLLLSYLAVWFQTGIIKHIKEINMKAKLANIKAYIHKAKLFIAQVWEDEKRVGAVLKKVDAQEMKKYFLPQSPNAFISPLEIDKDDHCIEKESVTEEKQAVSMRNGDALKDLNQDDFVIRLSAEDAPLADANQRTESSLIDSSSKPLTENLENSSQSLSSQPMDPQKLRESLEERIDLLMHSHGEEPSVDEKLSSNKNFFGFDIKENVDFDFSNLMMGKQMGKPMKVQEEKKEPLLKKEMIIDPEKRPVVLNSKRKEYLKNDFTRLTAKSTLLEYSEFVMRDHDFEESIRKIARRLESTIGEFGIEAKVVRVSSGPVITQYEITIEAGVKISKVVNLADNIALSLAAPSVRIVAPIPGKGVIGIEIPNDKRQMVRLRDVVGSDSYRDTTNALPIALGKSILGESVVKDLATTPHLLVAGATGSGKSVCVNSIITSLLIKRSPDQVRFIMIDPKMVELNVYNGVSHLLAPVITDPKKASLALRWVIAEMESRYYLLEKYGARSITSYNNIIKNKIKNNEFIEDNLGTLPYIVLIIDEFADLMMIAKKEVEDSVSRLAAMSRAVGIHLILATQRPSVDVITGVIKANFPSRIAFQVSSKIDSRTIIDANGADQLLGKGDMLYTDASSPFPERMQGAFLSDEEVGNIVKDLKSRGKEDYLEDIFTIGENTDKNALDEVQDDLFDEAVWVVINDKKASASYLQRKLKIGYNRAARIVEKMEEIGIVGSSEGSRPREVLVSSWQGINTLKASVS